MKWLKALIVVLACFVAAAATASAQQPVFDMPRLYQIVGHMYNIDPRLLEAIATAESNGDPGAVSPKGAEGLMQLMPGTAQQYRVENPFDPVENVFGAARFLAGLQAWSKLAAGYGEVDFPSILAAYNAGPGAVEKYGGIPPYAETESYVRKVLWLWLLGQPSPRRVNPRHSWGQVHYASVPQQPSRRALAHRFVSEPRVRVARPQSVFDKLADIRRSRERAKAKEIGAGTQLGSN